MFEKILGDSGEVGQEQSGKGEDLGISEDSPSSSPQRGGVSGGRGSPDISRSSSPLVSGIGNGSSSGYRSFAGAGSSTNIFDSGPALPPSPVMSHVNASSSSSSGQPPSYGEAMNDRLFGPMPSSHMYDDYHQPAKPVNFGFGSTVTGLGGGVGSGNGMPTTPTSTAGDMGDDSDRDADGEEVEDMHVDGNETSPMLGPDNGDGDPMYVVRDDDDEGLPVHDVQLTPEGEGEDKGGMDLGV